MNLFEVLAPLGDNFCGLALDTNVRVGVVGGNFQVQAGNLGPVGMGEALEACGGVDHATGSNVNEFFAILQDILDLVHVQGLLAKEDNVWATHGSAEGAAGFHGFVFTEHEYMLRIPFAGKAHQVAVHMENPATAGAFMKVVHVLGNQQKIVLQSSLQFRQSKMGCIRFVVLQAATEKVVEILHTLLVAEVSLGRTHVVNAFMLPHPVVSAEGSHSGFCTDSGSSQNNQTLFHKRPSKARL